MDQVGSRTESLSALGRGTGVGTISMGDVALAGAATMEADGPFPDAEGIAVGSVTVTPVEADVASVMADVSSMAADVASVEADVPSMAVDVASAAVGVPSVVVDVASAAVDVPSEVVDAASAEEGMATVEAEAAPMVAGTDRLRHSSKPSRPTAFAVGRFVVRHRLGLLERFSGPTFCFHEEAFLQH